MSSPRRTPTGLSLPEIHQTIAELREVRDDVALRRVWTAVAYPEVDELARMSTPAWRKERSSRRVLWFVGGAITAAAAAAVLWVGVPGGKNGIAAKETESHLSREIATAPAEASARAGIVAPIALVRGGAAVHTGEDPLPVSLPGGASATLAPRTTAKVEEDGRLVLLEGGSRFDVPLQTQTLVVQAGAYRVVVAGTRFRVDVAPPKGIVSLAVESGTAEIFAADAPDALLAHLAPGSRWSSDAHATEAGAPSGTVAATNEKAKEHGAWEVAFTGQRRRHRVSTRQMAASPGTERDGADERPVTEGVAAENAAYERGKNLRDIQHRPDAALKAWRECRLQHPSGVLRPEVDLSIFETLVRTHDLGAAISEGTAFLNRYPDSERRSEVARLVGDMQRTRGDCRRAIEAYDLALTARPRSDIEDHAAFERAACLVQNGDDGGAALQKYLDSHPAGRFRRVATSLLTGVGSRSP